MCAVVTLACYHDTGVMQSLQEQQSQWSIPDPLLRSNMKDALAEDFLPVYKVGLAHLGTSPICCSCARPCYSA